MTVKKWDVLNGYFCQWFAGKKLEGGFFAEESLQADTPPADIAK